MRKYSYIYLAVSGDTSSSSETTKRDVPTVSVKKRDAALTSKSRRCHGSALLGSGHSNVTGGVGSCAARISEDN